MCKFRHLKGTPGHKSTCIENLRDLNRTTPGECDGMAGKNIVGDCFITDRKKPSLSDGYASAFLTYVIVQVIVIIFKDFLYRLDS